MATITTLATGGASAGRTAAPVPYLVEKYIDFAAAATAKGSALAAADVIECITVPANTLILNAGFEVTTVMGGESSDNAFDLGTGLDVDNFVDGFDADAAAAGAYAQNAAAFQPVVIGATADTIDLLIQAATTAPTSGVVRVWAVLISVDGRIIADEVDRDQLA